MRQGAAGRAARRQRGGAPHQRCATPHCRAPGPPRRLQVLLVDDHVHAVVLVVVVVAALAPRAALGVGGLVLQRCLLRRPHLPAGPQAHVALPRVAPHAVQLLIVVYRRRHRRAGAGPRSARSCSAERNKNLGIFTSYGASDKFCLGLHDRKPGATLRKSAVRMWTIDGVAPKFTQMLDEVDEDAQNAALEVHARARLQIRRR